MNHRENAFNAPIRVTYRPPKVLLYLMTLSHFGALPCLLFVSLTVWLTGPLLVLILTNYYFFVRGFSRQQHARYCPQLCLGKDNRWSLLTASDESLAIQLQPGAFVHRLLLVLRFKAENGNSWSFILSPENVESHTLRRLRVRLLHGNL